MYSFEIRQQASAMRCQHIQYCPTVSRHTMIVIFVARGGLRRSSPILSLTSSSSSNRICPCSLFLSHLHSIEWQDYLLVFRIVPNFELTILGLC